MPEDRASFIVAHYRETYGVIQRFQRERNRIFLLLVGAVGVGVLLTWRHDTHSLAVDVIARLLDIEPARRDGLQQSFPFGLLQSTLMVAVFYWMVNLYHRSMHILRHYQYVGELEREIRAELKLSDDSAAFTREGAFYWRKRPLFFGSIKWVYVLLLGGLVAVFVGGRVWDDRGHWLMVAVDVVLAIPILLYYVAYVASSLRFDGPGGAFSGSNDAPIAKSGTQ